MAKKNLTFKAKLNDLSNVLNSYGVFGPTQWSDSFRDEEIAGFVTDVENNSDKPYNNVELTYRGTNVRVMVTTIRVGKKYEIIDVKAVSHPVVNLDMDYNGLNRDLVFVLGLK